MTSFKFKSLSITLWYNALPLIIFDHAFHTSTKPNPCTNFSHNRNVDSWLQHSLVKLLNIESHFTHFHMYHVICNMFDLIGHIWPPKTIIESIYLSNPTFLFCAYLETNGRTQDTKWIYAYKFSNLWDDISKFSLVLHVFFGLCTDELE